VLVQYGGVLSELETGIIEKVKDGCFSCRVVVVLFLFVLFTTLFLRSEPEYERIRMMIHSA